MAVALGARQGQFVARRLGEKGIGPSGRQRRA